MLYSTYTIKQMYIENFARLLLAELVKMSLNMKTKTKKYKKGRKKSLFVSLECSPLNLMLSVSQLAT